MLIISFHSDSLRNWKIEGSHDGICWKTLYWHREDKSLFNKGQTYLWSISSSLEYFQVSILFIFLHLSRINHSIFTSSQTSLVVLTFCFFHTFLYISFFVNFS